MNAERLLRLEQQLRTLGELHARELNDLAERVADGDPAEHARTLAVIARIHADEMRIALDEIAAIAAELAPPRADASAPGGSPRGERGINETGEPLTTPPGAARSAKRERWLAEEDRKAHPPPRSRRQLLRGRGHLPSGPNEA